MQVRWLRQLKNHTEYEKKSWIAPRNVGVEVESELKSVSGSCNGSREIKLPVFLRKHNWVSEKELGTRNGQMKMSPRGSGFENLAHGVCTDREGYVTLPSPEYCSIVLVGEPGMHAVCSKI